jgi:hypothetical protein
MFDINRTIFLVSRTVAGSLMVVVGLFKSGSVISVISPQEVRNTLASRRCLLFLYLIITA